MQSKQYLPCNNDNNNNNNNCFSTIYVFYVSFFILIRKGIVISALTEEFFEPN